MTKSVNGKVLLVDDEEMVTRNMEMLLRVESSLEPVAFNLPDQALAYLREETVDVVLADFVMPGINGLDFLAQVKTIQPATSRLLLTGYADKESAIRAINEIGLFQYLEKPWNNADVLVILRNAVERSQLLRKLNERTNSLGELRDQVWRMLV